VGHHQFRFHYPCSSARRAPGKPRKSRIKSSADGRGGLGLKKQNCKRCGGSGRIARTCKNAVDASFGEDEHWGEENAQVPTQPR
jgi:hypothetical protein